MLTWVLALSFIFSMSANVNAVPEKANKDHAVKQIVTSISHKEEKEINKLRTMGEIKVTDIKTVTNNVETSSKAKVRTVKQPIEERTYTDGSIERVTSLNYIVESDIVLPDPVPYTDNSGAYDMTMVLRAYITELSKDGGYNWEQKCDKVQSIYYKNGSLPQSVNKIYFEYAAENNPADWVTSATKNMTVNYPSAGYTYTYYPNDKYYIRTGNAHFAMSASVTYHISSGIKVYLLVDMNLKDAYGRPLKNQ